MMYGGAGSVQVISQQLCEGPDSSTVRESSL